MRFVPVLPQSRFFGDTVGIRTVHKLLLTETRYRPGLRLPRHRHAVPYVCVVLGGAFDEHGERREHACTKGTVVFNSCGESHHDVFGDGGAHVLNIQCDPNWLTEAGAIGASRQGALYRRDPRLRCLAGSLECELREQDDASALGIEGLVLELLAAFIRCSMSLPQGRLPAWLRQATDMIHDRFREPVRLGEIAETVGVNASHLARSFRKFHHCTVGDYLRRLRVECAHQAIMATNTPLAEIAVSAGFTDQSHMTRSIRQAYGHTPSSVRQSYFKRKAGPKAQI